MKLAGSINTRSVLAGGDEEPRLLCDFVSVTHGLFNGQLKRGYPTVTVRYLDEFPKHDIQT